MYNNCEYAKEGKSCLCDVCQAARKAIDDAEKIGENEVKKITSEMEKTLKKCGVEGDLSTREKG